jgi:hypothetical protein
MRRRTGTGAVGIRAVENVNTPVTITSTWARYSVTATATQTIGRTGVYVQTSGDEIDVWGFQLEAGAFPTSYIPTTTTALTRAADVASVNTLSPWYNAAEGTLFAEAQWNAPSAVVQQFASQFAGDTSNYIAIYKESSPANMTARVRQSGANQAYLYTTGTASANTTYKNAITYSASGFSACTNAGTVQTAPAGTIPTVSSLGLGKATYTNSVQLNGYLRRISYYPRVLSSAELQALTA